MKEVFLARLPILDCNQGLVAYELLFRTGDDISVEIEDNSAASANVIIDVYEKLGIKDVFGKCRSFIKVGADLLFDDSICLLPKENVIFEILRDVEINDKIIQRCVKLKQKGYQLALSNITELSNETKSLLPSIQIVKVDVSAINQARLVTLVKELKAWPVLLLAEKVESRGMEKFCVALKFQMLQGFYFTKPEIISGKRIEPSKIALLKLLLLVLKDSDVAEIANELKFQPGLSYNLLKVVNSAASSSRMVNSINRAIMILGRKQLQRWIQLLLYTVKKKDSGVTDALMLTAAVRGKLLESIAEADRPHDKNHQDRAFMVGTLSMLDTLLGIEMPKIIETLCIQKDMKDALLRRRGTLGKQLKLIEANENGELTEVLSILDDSGFLQMNEFTNMEFEALIWANNTMSKISN